MISTVVDETGGMDAADVAQREAAVGHLVDSDGESEVDVDNGVNGVRY